MRFVYYIVRKKKPVLLGQPVGPKCKQTILISET